ncbi:MAG: NAD(P)-binding protein [Erysipelotrichaceae bacterium]|nr:NAD(P)-binding protein [Erysipelotrichaceae bacterium]
MLLINNIKVGIDHNEDDIRKKIEKKLRHPVSSFSIYRKSLDARKTPVYVYSVLVEIEDEKKYLDKDVSLYVREDLDPESIKTERTCAVIGYGPSGIFSAYRLSQAGFRVMVFEKGKRINERVKDVERFFKEGILDERSNVQFGEGGAGTFSDAKLTTRIKDRYIAYITDILIRHGADPSIAYENHAHVGTDHIRKIIADITDHLIAEGVEFHFEEELTDIHINEDRKVTGFQTDKGSYSCDHLLLGIGHSSHDTFRMLKEKGVHIEPKDIAIGFRVEHPQQMIDERQTGSIVTKANEYFLRYKGEKGVYSFCMCPGGIVIPAMSEHETIVTNGMSYSSRDSGIANSAILIQIPKEEFDDGFEYLKKIEKDAYDYSGSYKALSQNISDFMKGELNPLIFSSTYPLGTVSYDFNRFFKEKDLKIIREAFEVFDRQIPGFIEKGIMVGPETRSSCPVRINRNGHMQSVNTPGLYPMGEGAGYGGGIMSCSLDGIRAANEIICNHEKI